MTTLAERFDRAASTFADRDFVTAAHVLAEIVAQEPDDLAARLLLARAYYHSAQLRRAEEQAREILDRNRAEGYAHLLLGRTLQRQSRPTEAEPHLRLAAALGADTDR